MKHTLTVTWESRNTVANLQPCAATAKWLAGDIKRMVYDLVDLDAQNTVVNLDGREVPYEPEA